ncbi:hypothetical protein ACJX0J_015583 [Zea mays]
MAFYCFIFSWMIAWSVFFLLESLCYRIIKHVSILLVMNQVVTPHFWSFWNFFVEIQKKLPLLLHALLIADSLILFHIACLHNILVVGLGNSLQIAIYQLICSRIETP